MVVKPDDIAKNWHGCGALLEDQIDDKLKKEWKGDRQVRFNLPNDLPSRIASELVRRYQEAGWIVRHEHGESQLDGSWNFLEFLSGVNEPDWSWDEPQ